MIKISAEYIKTELLKIAFLLESNYQKILQCKSKFKQTLNNMPVDWDLDSTEVSGRKVDTRSDLDPDDYIPTSSGHDLLRDISLEGKIQNSEIQIKVKYLAGAGSEGGSSSNRNYYSLFVKDDSGKWEKLQSGTQMSAIARAVKHLDETGEKEDIVELREVYNAVLKKGKGELLSNFKEWMGDSRSWQTVPESKTLKLNFVVNSLEPEEKAKIDDTFKENKVEEKLTKLINGMIEKASFDPSHISIKFGLKPHKGISVFLKHA